MNKNHSLWLNLFLLVMLVGTGFMASCSDEEDIGTGTTPTPLSNQIRFNKEVTDIRSVVWSRNSEGLYTLYLTPQEQVGSLQQLGDSYLQIETRNVTTFDAGSDAFRLAYTTLQVDQTSLHNDATALQLTLHLDPKLGTFLLKADVQMKSGERLEAAFEGAASRLMPQVDKNEINYNGDQTSLQASAWKRDAEGLYTFYMAPQEIGDAEQLEGKFLKLSTSNPANFDAQNDAFTLTYGDLVLTQQSVKSGYNKFNLELGFNPATSQLGVAVEAHSESGDVLLASYAGQSHHLRPAVADGTMALNGQAVQIASVVWEKQKDGNLSLYLSPRKGIATYEELQAENDYLQLQAAAFDGPLTGSYQLAYGNFTLQQGTECIDCQLSATLHDGQLALQLYALTADFNELYAGYQGKAYEIEPMPLKNQWQVDREPALAIRSALEWRGREATEFYLCNTEVGTPQQTLGTDFIRIVMPQPVAEQTDLSQAEGVRIVCGNLDSDQAKQLSGSLRISKNELHKSLIVSLDAELDGVHLRAEWNGAYRVGYASTNTLALTTVEGETLTAQLPTVFINSTSATHCLAFGLNEQAATVHELMDRYALQFNVTDLNQQIDLAQSQTYNLKVFDYANFLTFDSSKESVEGTLDVWTDGTSKVYFYLDATFGNGIHALAEWFGDCTATEEFDLTPVKPFKPNFKITQADGEVTKEEEIIELQVRENPNFQSNVSGATFHAFEFYFVNKHSAASGVNDASATPVLVVSKDYIGHENIDLTQNACIFDFQYRAFHNSGIASPTEWSGTTDRGTLTVLQDGDNWKISFEVLNFGNWWGWGDPSGDKSVFTAEWEGPASPYTGN